MPQVRARPTYPGLRQDGKVDRNMVSGMDGIGCNKFFAEYGKKGYTGGVLGFLVHAWHLLWVPLHPRR